MGQHFVYIATLTVYLLALTCGIAISWSSPILAKLEDKDNIDDNPLGNTIDSEENSWLSSLLALGAVFGPFPSAYLADKVGRKITLLLLAVPFAVSFFILAFAKTISLYYVARVMAGIGVGGAFTVLPMYVSEVAEPRNRGMLSSGFNSFICLGLFASYAIGPYTSIPVFNIISGVVPCIFLVLFTIFIPESPYYLIGANKIEAATSALKKIRGTSDVALDKEMEGMKDEMEKNSQGSFMDLFRSRGLIKALAVSMSLVGFQQLSGINVVLFNTQTIFEATGSDIPSDISSIIVGAVQLLSSFVTPSLVDKLGRRILLIFSGIGMFISEMVLGIFFYLKDNTETDVNTISWLPVLSLVLYIIAYCSGFGPLPWTVMGEIFPSNVKSMASSLTAGFSWLLAFILTKFFIAISDEIHMYGSFWLFSGLCVVAAFFTFFCVPETKGKSFQEIQKEFNM